jgi:hypothetical protein
VRKDLAHTPQTVVATDVATIHSPFGERLTDKYAEAIGRAGRRVARLLEVDPATIDLQVQLVPFTPPEHDDPLTAVLMATQQGREGWRGYVVTVNGENWMILYVPDIREPGFQGVFTEQALVVHEMVHAMLDESGLGGDRPRWFEEGLAEVIETLPVDDEGRPRFDAPVPIPVHLARTLARPGDLERLTDWSRVSSGSRLDPQAEAPLYPLAMAFTWYVMSETSDGSVLERAEACNRLTLDESHEMEDAWLTWLAELDLVEDFARLVRSDDLWLRQRALAAMTDAAADNADFRQRRFIDAALNGVSDPYTFWTSSHYLIQIVADRLTEADLATLTDSGNPAECLLAQALQLQIGRPLDDEVMAACREALPEEWLEPTLIVRLSLDLD